MMTDISAYLDFVLVIFLAFGLSFELPVALVILVLLGWVTTTQLRERRGYAIVGIFIVAAVITPPDVVSQLLLAIPMCCCTKSASSPPAGSRPPARTLTPPEGRSRARGWWQQTIMLCCRTRFARRRFLRHHRWPYTQASNPAATAGPAPTGCAPATA